MEMKKLSLYLFIAILAFSCEKSGQANFDSGVTGGETGGAGGTGGSTARFAISGNTLYAVNVKSLKAFDISTPGNPQAMGETAIGNDIETIFPKDNFLFIGSQSGMFIYDISNPSGPVQVGVYTHVISCDPVVANDDYAYVTLRNATNGRCGRGLNQLEILDISNPAQPKLINTAAMTSPRGLGIDQNWNLFVCDNGLKHLDVSDPKNIVSLATYPMTNALDVIPIGKLLFVIAEDGFYQYELVNGSLKLLSKIAVG